MVSSDKALYIPQGERVAQLLLLPCLPPSTTLYERGQGGFGSTNKLIRLNTKITSDRSQCKISIQAKSFTGLLDTGADVSIIALKHWPKNWPKQEKHIQVSSIGTASQVWQSLATLHCLGPGKQLAFLRPLIVDVAIKLWR
ncbi:Endogenous retrovirus group K member 9 Pol protein [Manis javanica]|nr:Endogenous retrovirus group K member 9 Pol protein [Manis javanica]